MPLIAWIYLCRNFYDGLRKNFSFLQEWRFGCSRSSKVTDLGNNRKCVWNFLLVCNSDLGSIYLAPFRRFCTFLCSWPHPYSALILSVFPLHQITHVGVSQSIGLRLFGHGITFKVFQPVWKTYLNITDRRTVTQTTYCRTTTLCIALRGKNIVFFPVICLGAFVPQA